MEYLIADDEMALKNSVRLQLAMLPAEVLLEVYEVLPSLADALSLRATCHTLRDVWLYIIGHRTVTINKLVSNFECDQHARKLLAYQRKGLEQGYLSDGDLSNLVRNAKRIEEVIENIEQNFIPRLQINGPESKRSTIYGGNEAHPSTLTQTERLRVIGACYQIWSLISHDNYTTRRQLRPMTLEELFYLAALAGLARELKFPDDRAWTKDQIIRGRRITKGDYIISHVGSAISGHYSERCQAPMFNDPARVDVRKGLLVIWDHWQDMLMSLLWKRPLSDLQFDARQETTEYLRRYKPGD